MPFAFELYKSKADSDSSHGIILQTIVHELQGRTCRCCKSMQAQVPVQKPRTFAGALS